MRMGFVIFLAALIAVLFAVNLAMNASTDAGPKAEIAAPGRKSGKTIQAAIDAAARNGGGDVDIAAGRYDVTDTIVVKPSVRLRLNTAAILVPVRDVNVIELQRNSSVSGGIIYAYETKGFDRSGVYLDGAQHFSGTLSTAEISDLKIVGPPGAGNGIFFHAVLQNDHISWVQATNVNITGFYKAIHFKTEPVQSPDKVWINGNNFSQILIKDSVYGIYIDGHSDLPYEISGNQFTNVQIQTNAYTKQAIYVKGTKNVIQAMIWDYHQGAEAIYFDKDSYRNLIQSNVSAGDEGYRDLGRNNVNLSAGG